ncbi:MAG: SHOCT domain-containing protein [Bacillota bacterium]
MANRVLTVVLAIVAVLFLGWIVVGWPAAMWGPGSAGLYGVHPWARWMMGYGRAGFVGRGWPLAFMVICWALVIAGAYLLVRWFIGNTRTAAIGPRGGGDQALSALRDRYARGEITDEEYDRMRSRLEGGAGR